MKSILILFLIFTTTIVLYSQPQNIMIGSLGEPEEPSIFINSKNPAIIMAGANIDKVYLSTDTGRTWSFDTLHSNSGVWGDPCITSDTAGDFLFLHLANPPSGTGHWIDRIISQKYNTQQNQWVVDTFMGLDGRPDYAQDKEWIAVDRNTNHLYVTWTQFDKYGVSDPTKKSNILFSKSTDGGASWSVAKKINQTSGDCVDSDNTVEGAVPAVGPNGEIYVAWAGPDGLVFDRSSDGGSTWLDTDIVITSIPGGWDYDIPGISRCNGLPITDCDISGGQYNGNIYVNWSDQRNGSDNTDIWLVSSSDGGDNWTAPIRVNNDTTQNHQFLTWMDIDQSTGYLYFVFYDRRNYPNNLTDVFLAVSKDGGQSFENYRISESPFMPTSSVFFGDYNNISVQNGIVRPIWTRFDGTNYLSIWTAIINPETNLSIADNASSNINIPSSIYPNPSENIVYFAFKLKHSSMVNLDVYDINGRFITRIIDNKNYNQGEYIQEMDINKYNLKPGVYQFNFSSRDNSFSKQFIVK
jgi:hypothetical protein